MRKDVITRRPYGRVGFHDHLPSYIELAIVDIIRKEIELTRYLETFRISLQRSYDYSAGTAFNTIDRLNLGFIDEYQLREFFKRNCQYMDE